MPAKKNKSKFKKRELVTYFPPEDIAERLDAAQSWQDVANLLCEWLEIPDLETRQGLKRTHKNFDDIASKLKKLWEFAAQMQNYDLAGGITAIYCSMCVDVVLRNRIVEDADFIPKLFWLIEQPGCEGVALDALAMLTHLGGGESEIRAIAKRVAVLLQVLDDHIDDKDTRTFAWVVLSHAGRAVFITKPNTAPSISEVLNLDVPRMIRSGLECMRFPQPSQLLSGHILSFFCSATHHCSHNFFDSPSAINFLLSCVRSKSIQTRAEAVGALLRLNLAKSKTEDLSFDQDTFFSAFEGKDWPDHILCRLGPSGIKESDSTQIASTTRDLQQSMMRVSQDHDFLRLGREFAEYITRTEYAIAKGYMGVEDTRTGEFEIDSCGLPFTLWLDALPYCARKLRQDGGLPGDKDRADILDCKYFFDNHRYNDAQALAKNAIERGSQAGYLYYIATFGLRASACTTHADALRVAKRGLECTNLSNYVKSSLLYRAAGLAFELALFKLNESNVEPQARAEGYDFAHSAWEDTETFIQIARPDNRLMPAVCHLHTLLAFVLYGHRQGPDMPLLEGARRALQIADDMARHLGYPVTDTQLRLTANLFQAKMTEASAEWGAITSCYEEHRPQLPENNGPSVGGLTAWLNKAEPEDINLRGHTLTETHLYDTAMTLKDAALYTCSWCGNPSTALRKCRGCGMVRYCGASCQREHWITSHRKVCVRKDKNTASESTAGATPSIPIAA